MIGLVVETEAETESKNKEAEKAIEMDVKNNRSKTSVSENGENFYATSYLFSHISYNNFFTSFIIYPFWK